MVDYSFIRLETSLEKAHNLQESPFVTHTYLNQIQLLPRNPKPYFQNTCNPEGVSILSSDFVVYLVDCNGQKEDITVHFTFETIQDENSVNQIAFRLAYLPTDYYYDLVYLEIQSDERTYYSNRFLVTNLDAHLTSRLDYKLPGHLLGQSEPFLDYYSSIQLSFYYNDHVDRDDVQSYLMISLGQILNTNTIHSDLIEWRFDKINSFVHKRLKRAVQKGKAYINLISNQSADPFEYGGRIERSNLGTTTFLTDQYEEDVLAVEDVIIEPEAFLASSGVPTSSNKLISDENE